MKKDLIQKSNAGQVPMHGDHGMSVSGERGLVMINKAKYSIKKIVWDV